MRELMPGDLVVIKDCSLVRRYLSEEEHYTHRLQNGLVIMMTHVWTELGSGQAEPTYLVLFSRDMRLYYVARTHMLTPDQASDPSRLFGQLSG
jgi:hypothetical protein